MRTKYVVGVLLMVFTISTFFSSCEKDEFDDGIEMRMRNLDNGNDSLWILAGETSLSITSSNNFNVWKGQIADVGSVRNLGKVTSIPTSGWANEVAVKPGHGYVVSSDFCDEYARVYVKDWIEGTSGGILGAVIVYQDHWK